ncbi:MAG TPA: transketolase C-terminal domain-containing protein, partial [Candidatus Omnitrophota bacterium]|nr:transketolase C-terminal domain-containing protein [Candidatus Omnitrophota bacterium]
WKTCGFGAEVAAFCSENAFRELKAPVTRLGFPDCPSPTAQSLEEAYYIDSGRIVDACVKLMYRLS